MSSSTALQVPNVLIVNSITCAWASSAMVFHWPHQIAQISQTKHEARGKLGPGQPAIQVRRNCEPCHSCKSIFNRLWYSRTVSANDDMLSAFFKRTITSKMVFVLLGRKTMEDTQNIIKRLTTRHLEQFGSLNFHTVLEVATSMSPGTKFMFLLSYVLSVLIISGNKRPN